MHAYTIIDVDTHVTEVADLWTRRAPASMRDRVPRVETDARGRDFWYLGADRVAPVGLTATAGTGDFKEPPRGYADMHPGAFDAQARLEYMDRTGIWAMVLYPNVGGFGAQEFLKLRDPELMLTCVQIYNDWQTEWASADARRLLPITSIPFWDVAASVRDRKELSWKEWGGRLHDYVAVLEKLFWPELIIVGGGVSADHAKFFKFIKPRAKLVPAEFFNNAGIVGAALWAAEKK